MAERVAVIGAGLAGLLVRHYLEASGREVVGFGSVLNSTRPPAALLHPFPGRSMDLSEYCVDAYSVAKRLAESTGAQKVVVERPAPKGSREYTSYMRCRANYPEWLEHSLNEGTLRYGPAWVFDLACYLRNDHPPTHVDRIEVEDPIRVVCGNETTEFSAVVICPGVNVLDWWQVSASPFGGEMMLCDKSHAHDVVVGGPLHQLPCRDGRLALGHTFIAPGVVRPDDTVIKEYRARLGEESLIGEVWRGQRCVYADRQPLCGEVAQNVYLLGALGARGLLLGPMLAEILARKIVGEEAPIPIPYDVRRASGLPGYRLIVEPGFLA